MSGDQSTPERAATAAEAIRSTLQMYGVTGVEAGAPDVLRDGDPLAALPVPGVAASVAYRGPQSGRVVLGMSPRAARMLAAAVMGQSPSAVDDATELSDLERSALAESTGELLSAAVGAIGAAAGFAPELGAPAVHVLASAGTVAPALAEGGALGVATTLTVSGETFTLLQPAPPGGEDAPAMPAPAAVSAPEGAEATGLGSALRDTKLRVWAEIGRARLPVGRVVGLPAGAVLELDKLVDDPVDIFVNGRRYAIGRLVVDDGGEWAVRLESLLA